LSFILYLPCATGGFAQHRDARIITQNLYPGCIELSNQETRVVLEPNLGGRILVYETNGKNILYIMPEFDGKIYEPGVQITPSAGRSDIGPERAIPQHPILWLGKWEARITGPGEAEMTSQKDSATGVQLIRKFKLAEKGSKLEFTQIIRNISNEPKTYCHWSRTFVNGNGISLAPVDETSKFPGGYLNSGPPSTTNAASEDKPELRVREGVFEILGPTANPKFYTDSYTGWLAYISPDNLLFIKKFTTYPEKTYGDRGNATASIYYFRDQFCEIEPIGPMELIQSGKEASFTETWYLMEYPFPANRLADLNAIKAIIATLE
jgi:hypothetical protein